MSLAASAQRASKTNKRGAAEIASFGDCCQKCCQMPFFEFLAVPRFRTKCLNLLGSPGRIRTSDSSSHRALEDSVASVASRCVDSASEITDGRCRERSHDVALSSRGGSPAPRKRPTLLHRQRSRQRRRRFSSTPSPNRRRRFHFFLWVTKSSPATTSCR
jgi:hypothetical protein